MSCPYSAYSAWLCCSMAAITTSSTTLQQSTAMRMLCIDFRRVQNPDQALDRDEDVSAIPSEVQQIPLPDELSDRIHVDFAGPLLVNMWMLSWTPIQSGPASFVCRSFRLRRRQRWRSTLLLHHEVESVRGLVSSKRHRTLDKCAISSKFRTARRKIW